MKTIRHPRLDIRRWKFSPLGAALVATITLFASTPRAQGQARWGHSLKFEFDNQMEVAHANALNSYPLTLSAWINTTNRGPASTIAHKGVPGDGFSLFQLDGRIRAWYCYTNGVQIFAPPASGPIGDANAALNDFLIGTRQALARYFQGQIDEVRHRS